MAKKIWYEVWMRDTQNGIETLLAKVKSPGLAYVCKNSFVDLYKPMPEVLILVK